MELNSDVK